MKNTFAKENIIYKSELPLTPYQRAQQEWDMRIGSSRLQAKNWRTVAFMAVVVALLLLIILTLTIISHKEKIYIAEVTKEGKVVNVSPLVIHYQPNDAQKEYFITHFIKLTRSIPLDPVLAKKNWLAAYDFLDGRGAERLNQYFRQNNPIALLGKKTITVQIADINPLTPFTYNVNWDESIINTEGQEEAKNQYSGVFTIVAKQPTKREEILLNPLGIRITDFNITPKMGKKGQE